MWKNHAVRKHVLSGFAASPLFVWIPGAGCNVYVLVWQRCLWLFVPLMFLCCTIARSHCKTVWSCILCYQLCQLMECPACISKCCCSSVCRGRVCSACCMYYLMHAYHSGHLSALLAMFTTHPRLLSQCQVPAANALLFQECDLVCWRG